MRRVFFVVLLITTFIVVRAQEGNSFTDKAFELPDKLFGVVQKKSERFQSDVFKGTEKYLNKLQKQEIKMRRRLEKKDSTAAKELFGDIDATYASLNNKLKDGSLASSGTDKNYTRIVDSLTTAFKFLGKLNAGNNDLQSKISGAINNYDGIQRKLDQSANIQQLLVARQNILKDRLSALGLKKQFNRYQGDIYYYREKMRYYKETLNDPQKLEAVILKHVVKLPAFEKFFNKYSDLAGLFRLPQEGDPANLPLDGLQTRAMIESEIRQRFGSGPDVRQYVRNELVNAEAGLGQVKNKLQQLGNSGNDMDMPNFRPNNEKSKTFFERIVFGANLQSAKSNFFMPGTSDVGLSAGYRLSEKSIIGTGIGYKMGWGRDIRHISITHQGISVRTFADIKLIKSFWLSGGFELNHLSGFSNFEQLKNSSAWQRSGLIGISKKISLKNKFLKSTKLQLMWDFLSYKQVPQTQAIVYRIGYDF